MDVNFFHLLIWGVIFLILVVIEVLTVNIVTAWFILGSVLALFSTFFTKNLNIQIIVFLIVSIISMFCLKDFLEKVSNFKKIDTNVSSIIGKTCLVTKEVNNLLNQGEVSVDNNIWTAVSKDESKIINVGSKVKIIAIRGVKAIVEEI